MDYREVEGAREYVARLDHGVGWRSQIEDFADEEGIDAAFFVGLGAVQDATLLFYDQDDQEYYDVEFDEPFEVVPAVGVTVGTWFSWNRSKTDDIVIDVGPMMPATSLTLISFSAAEIDASGDPSVSPWTSVTSRPPTPPCSLTSSASIRTTGRTFSPTHAYSPENGSSTPTERSSLPPPSPVVVASAVSMVSVSVASSPPESPPDPPEQPASAVIAAAPDPIRNSRLRVTFWAQVHPLINM
mgnify:CR=1 FL=1